VGREVAPMSRPRRFARTVSWVVAASFACAVSIHAQTASPGAKPTQPTGDAAQPKADSQAPDTAAPKPAAETKPTPSQCEEYVAVLSGTKKDDALLKDPKLRALAARSFDLVGCGGIVADSDASCALIADPGECRLLWATFHELRTNPQGRAFMFPDFKYEMCRTEPKLAATCDRMRDALRSGDTSKCAGMGAGESDCRAMIKLDKSLCGKGGDDLWGCRKAIEANEQLAKGLKGIAESGPPRERAFAKAALGEADACKPFAQAAMASCAAPTAASGASVTSTTVPAPSRDVPAPQ
jgi:hypothetical protein